MRPALFDTEATIEHEFADVEVFVASADVTKKNESGPDLREPVRDADSDKFLKAIQHNLSGSLFVAQAFLRYASTDAVVIDVNSFAARLNFGPGFALKSVAKLAIFRLWDSLAFANPDLNVFHVQPGVVDTAMNREAGGVAAAGFEDHGEWIRRMEHHEADFDLVSLLASFNVWLASPEARFLKGKFLWTNWDVNELKSRTREVEASIQLNIGLIGWPFENGS